MVKKWHFKKIMDVKEERRDPVTAERDEREKKDQDKSQSLRRNPALGPRRN